MDASPTDCRKLKVKIKFSEINCEAGRSPFTIKSLTDYPAQVNSFVLFSFKACAAALMFLYVCRSFLVFVVCCFYSTCSSRYSVYSSTERLPLLGKIFASKEIDIKFISLSFSQALNSIPSWARIDMALLTMSISASVTASPRPSIRRAALQRFVDAVNSAAWRSAFGWFGWFVWFVTEPLRYIFV